MKIRDIMSDSVIRIHPEETVAVAARTLTHYNIGALPVCGMGSLGDLAGREESNPDAADALQDISANISKR